MKLVGFTGSDFNVNQLEALGANIEHMGSVEGSLIVAPYNAYIAFDSYDEGRYRPYLVLDSEIQGAKGDFGHGITEFRYREKDRLNRSVRYDFTDYELSVLVGKGLYNPEFQTPELFVDTDFEIPVTMDVSIVRLEDNVLVYGSYDMISDLRTNSEKSGYDNLVTYFDDQQVDINLEHDDVNDEFTLGDNTYVYEPEFDPYDNQVEDEHEVQEHTVDVEPEVEEEEVNVTPEVVQSPLERLTHINLDSILEDKTHAVDKYVDDAETTIVEKHEVEHAEAPSQPSIESHSVKVEDVVNDYDAAKAMTNAMMDNALSNSREFGPNKDADDFSQDF